MLGDDNNCGCPFWTCATIFTILILASNSDTPKQQVTLSSTMFPLDSYFTQISTAQLFNETSNESCFVPIVVTTSAYGEFDLVNFTVRRYLRGGHSGGHSSGHSGGHSEGHSSQSHANPTRYRTTSTVRATTAIVVLHTFPFSNVYLSGHDKKYILYQNEICVESETFTIRADEALWGNSWFGRAWSYRVYCH